MTSLSKSLYIDNLDDIVNKYKDTYHRTIKIKLVDVKDSTYIDSIKDVKDKDAKFKVDDHVRISKQKNIFAIGHTSNWSEDFLQLKKLKIQCLGHVSLMISMVKKLLKRFIEKNCKKQIKKNLGYKK